MSNGAFAWEVVQREAKIRKAVNQWLDSLGTNCEFVVRNWRPTESFAQRGEPQMLGELVLMDKRARKLVTHRDIGVGISQMLPIVVNAFGTSGHIHAIEQPEIHVHPALQAEIGDVFIESALGERKNIFLLETHSEHLILRILRRIRETTERKPNGLRPLRPEDVSVLYVQPTQNGSKIIELPVTPDGDFERPWPNGFFAERFNDLP